MSACLVWRCNGAALKVGPFCSRHASETARASVAAPDLRPYGAAETALADLTDPDRMAEDIAAHNARERTLALLPATL